jgi:cellulose synthase/poly-beta-1,6-N-acetylglucosamine synthase-like glycosyltransferase/spore germination protein YaaH/peptidoglycan/xylan/chitin deacetylase (PgdA/CDA1 family)
MSDRAVFFDPSRRRWWWVKRVGTLFGLFAVVTVSIWLLSLFTVPFLPTLPGITGPSISNVLRRSLRRSIHLPRHQTRLEQFLLKRDRQRLLSQISHEQQVQHARAARPPIQGGNIVAAFYAPWQETGLHSLRANAAHMTHLLPSWVHLQESAKGLDFHDWDPELVPHNKDVLDIARSNNLNIVPVFSNAQMSDFDAKRVHVFLTHPEIQDRIIFQLRQWLLSNHFQGINFDFENLLEEDNARYVPFLQRLKTSFAPYHLVVSADLEPSRPINWRAVSSVCDFIVVMAYDEHGETSKPGPIASIGWYRTVLEKAIRFVPREKLVIGLANYAYDWMEGRDWADPLTYQGALITAEKYRDGEKPEDVVDFDDQALNPTFWYVDDAGKQHEVWFLDAVTAANQWLLAQNYGLRGVAVWVLGSTDPSIWNFIQRERLNHAPNMADLREVKFPYDVEFVGDGEIAHVERNPTDGSRSMELDPRTGLALDESYHQFPTSYVIARTGFRPNMIALTIDDGPADPYTSAMLDELKKYNVKATFFLIGQNAERHPGLVRRIWNEGHEIGNHSFTHPNIGAMPDRQARLELTATQRVFQSLLHRSTLLFRPPYNADAEPTSAEEVKPIALASSMNYVTVLEFLDPQDWNTEERLPNGTKRHRTAQDMLQSVLAQIDTEHGSSILLHDGGGDRSETVKLIPLLIQELRKRGYRFVTVSALIGATRDEVNPPVTSQDTLMLANDRVVFEAIYLFELFLSIAFVTAIILGAARVFFVTLLALIAKYRSRHARWDDTYRPTVSVVIAAFNEEKVIARTIRAVLANRYDPIEIIVVDDGSKDGTSGEVIRDFADNPKIRLLRQDNSGKASALNHGISEATGEIIIALDADTIFGRRTIANLIRHFASPLVGAVAGNVKVGNRLNPLTYWQSIEYVTSQNLDRRAYAIINSVTVVPGAVGAWRREAVLQAGGYTTDTMAEDMDLTWRIRRIGWTIETDSDAVGYTEAPDSFRALFGQRFRWAFGTLQCLWKHRRAVGRYGWFGSVMLPSLWLFQVVFQALSPLIDVQILWTLGNVASTWWWRGWLTHDWQPLPQALTSLYLIGFMYAFFFVVELVGSIVAFKLDNEDSRVLVWLFWQRFLYRQLMYAVLLKSLKTAISGIRAGWGKLERKGTVDLLPDAPELLRPTEQQP